MPGESSGRRSCQRATTRYSTGSRVTGKSAGALLSRARRSRALVRRISTAASGASCRCPGIGSLFGLGRGIGRRRAVLRLLLVLPAPHGVSRLDLSDRATGSLWRRVEADLDPPTFRGRAGYLPVPGRDGGDDVRGPPEGRSPATVANPTYLTGYGGFNISMTPAVRRSLLLVDRARRGAGGAEPPGRRRIRRGLAPGRDAGEQAERVRRFHRRGGVPDRGRVHLAGPPGDRRAAPTAGSSMGAALTQRPDLFRAVVLQVPLLDMLRYHQFRIARLWIPEYGSADDPAQFALAARLLAVPPRARRARRIPPSCCRPPRATAASIRCTHGR